MSKQNNITTIIGTGHMGQQIALQCAVNGLQVCMCSRKEQSISKAKTAIEQFIKRLIHIKLLKTGQVQEVLNRITYTTDIKKAVTDADIIIECIVEDLQIKQDLFKNIEPFCGENTLLCTNSSAIVPSRLASVLKHPKRFIAIHFHTYVWEMNFVDIMPHPTTDQNTIEQVKKFAVKIKQIPIVLKKESPGYIFTALLSSLNNMALKLVRDNVADVAEIDKAWRAAMKMPIGPFGIMDYIGLDTLRDVCLYWGNENNDEDVLQNAEYLSKLVEEGKLGVKSGNGFYNYSKANL